MRVEELKKRLIIMAVAQKQLRLLIAGVLKTRMTDRFGKHCHLLKRGKKPIRLSVTVWNRSKPRDVRRIQANRHKGKMMFCAQNPSNMEGISKESTHYQRAHRKNVVRRLFSKKD